MNAVGRIIEWGERSTVNMVYVVFSAMGIFAAILLALIYLVPAPSDNFKSDCVEQRGSVVTIGGQTYCEIDGTVYRLGD